MRIFKLLKRLINYVFGPEQRWILLARKKGQKEFTRIFPPEKKGWADPFIVKEKGKFFVFFEEYEIRRNFGTISVGELEPETLTLKNVRKVLERPHHLSYPNVFKIKDSHYMMPETIGTKTITLFKAVSFPDAWKEKKNPRPERRLLRHHVPKLEGEALSFHVQGRCRQQGFVNFHVRKHS